MEDKQILAFGDLNELTKKQKERFYGFEKLNLLVTSWSELYESYVKVVLDTGNQNVNLDGYSHLEREIRRLIEEEKIEINLILEFANTKFINIKEYITKMLYFLSPYSLEGTDFGELADEIIKYKKGNLVLIAPDYFSTDGSNDIIIRKIPFDIENIGEFKDLLSKLDISLISGLELVITIQPLN